MKIQFIETKNIIVKSNLPDADFVINPYTGCQHACIYCYADFIMRFTGHIGEEWGEFVDVKFNAPDTIKKRNFVGKKLLLGSVTDPYQPIEAKYKITRQVLEKIRDFNATVEIITKSHLVVRDIDILKQFRNIRIGISISCLDERMSSRLEPRAASPRMRIDALKKLASQEIPTYVFISPIFPRVTNYREIIDATVDYVGEYLFENLNIRNSKKRKIEAVLRDINPELIDKYRSIYKNKMYWNDKENEIAEYCIKRNIKHKIYFNHGKNIT